VSGERPIRPFPWWTVYVVLFVLWLLVVAANFVVHG